MGLALRGALGHFGGMAQWPQRRVMKAATAAGPAAGPGRAVEAWWAVSDAGRWELAKLVGREAAEEDGRQWVFRLSETGAAVVQMGLLLEG